MFCVDRFNSYKVFKFLDFSENRFILYNVLLCKGLSLGFRVEQVQKQLKSVRTLCIERVGIKET